MALRRKPPNLIIPKISVTPSVSQGLGLGQGLDQRSVKDLSRYPSPVCSIQESFHPGVQTPHKLSPFSRTLTGMGFLSSPHPGAIGSPLLQSQTRATGVNSPLFSGHLPFKTDPTKILPNLYLGNIAQASDYQSLTRLGINCIVDCCNLTQTKHKDIEYLKLDISDNVDFQIKEHFSQSNSFIESNLRKGNVVLVHCQQAASRSVAIITAFLMAYVPSLKNHLKALTYVSELHPVADPNWGFVEQLHKWEPPNVEKHFEPLPIEIKTPISWM